MSDLHVVPGNEGFGLIDHIKAIDERLGRIEMLLEATSAITQTATTDDPGPLVVPTTPAS